MHPNQNLREIIKQCIMLEDHLVQPEKRCSDCTSKHMLAIEALAEECGTLCDPRDKETSQVAAQVAHHTRVLHHVWAQKQGDPQTCRAVAARLRTMRKHLMTRYATLPLSSLPSDEQAAVKSIAAKAPK